MSLWVAVYRLKKQSFLTLTDFQAINYREMTENVLNEYKGIEELPEYPSLKALRHYIGRLEGESKDVYYERALAMLPQVQHAYEKVRTIWNIGQTERQYLENDQHYEELFFVKRCYDLASSLRTHFPQVMILDHEFSVVLDEAGVELFNQVSGSSVVYDEEYMYKLEVG